MTGPDERCEWSDMLRTECDHCLGARTQAPNEHVRYIGELRLEVQRLLEAQSTEVSYPRPIVRPQVGGAGKRIPPRWDRGNVAAQIGGDLTLIKDMFNALREEAETRHSDHEFPGGDAMVMLGPGADVEAFGYVQISAMVGRINEDDVVLPEKRDLEPPLSFLASWTDIIRDQRDQPTDLAATIDREIDYLRKSIDWMFSHDPEGQPHFIQVDELANGLSHVRRRLEDILKDGSRAEFTRVNCIALECETHPRLMKLWAAQVRWDRYRCPACRTEYDKAQFVMARSQNLHASFEGRYIAPRDAAEATGVPIKTVYSWMARRNVDRVWVMPTGVAHVWWPHVRDRSVARTLRLREVAVRRDERRARERREEARLALKARHQQAITEAERAADRKERVS
jgi:hypothetical protein